MNPFYKISIDQVNDNYISGWCFHRLKKSRCVQLALYCGGECLGEISAEQFREDLHALGVHPSGKCGFEMVFNRKILQGEGALELVDMSSGKLLYKIEWEHFSIKKRIPFGKFITSVISFSPAGKEKILFMHIPKTAGTSFNTLIRSLDIKGLSISHIEFSDEATYPALKKRYRYISGHLRFGIFKKHFCGDNTALYSIVREPFSHLHSHLRWVVRNLGTRGDYNLKYSNRTIYDLSCKVRAFDFSDAAQIKEFIVGMTSVDAAFFDNMQTRHFLDNRVERVSLDNLKQAITNTGEFKLIGVTEQFETFCNDFIALNNLVTSFESGKLNRSRSEPLFDSNNPEIRQALFPLVEYDLMLYDHVKNSYK